MGFLGWSSQYVNDVSGQITQEEFRKSIEAMRQREPQPSVFLISKRQLSSARAGALARETTARWALSEARATRWQWRRRRWLRKRGIAMQREAEWLRATFGYGR